MKFAVDKTSPTPAYLQLKNGLAGAIMGGSIRAGEALPSERELADSLALSRMTVRRALEELAAAGLVERRHGSGTYALARRLEQSVDRVLGFTDEARLLGFTPGSRLLEAVRIEADAQAAAALELEPGELILRVTRLRTADGEPLAIQESHLCPAALALPLAALERSGSLYQTLAQSCGLKPHHARQVVSARMPTPAEARRLGLARGVPLLAIMRVTFDGDNRPFEYARSAYRGDKYGLALELKGSTED
ncbi:MAG: GntR family transcriptional regulator [Deinococcota bacterium]|nr:GntR family transcriptional regulator [Deinococcota bacterium]